MLKVIYYHVYNVHQNTLPRIYAALCVPVLPLGMQYMSNTHSAITSSTLNEGRVDCRFSASGA